MAYRPNSNRRFPNVEIKTLTDDYMEFHLKDTDPSMSNALRRIILAEVWRGMEGAEKGAQLPWLQSAAVISPRTGGIAGPGFSGSSQLWSVYTPRLL
jgi:hypothetical protein